jgi:methylated-DNA-[protein]-cysteine S-methyltransferase
VLHLIVVTPLGPLTLREEAGALVALGWRGPATGPKDGPDGLSPVLTAAQDQLEAYFAGRLRLFDLPLAPAGTAFQRALWGLLGKIPYGSTETYGSLARRFNTAPRAVGAACARNPIPILIPCHRVLGTGGQLGGYSGRGGAETKRFLLRLEQASARALRRARP